MVITKLINKLRQIVAIVYREVISTKVFIISRNYLFQHRYDSIQANYISLLNSLRNKCLRGGRISVAFYLWETSKWKSEPLYRLLEKDARFDPYIVIVPFAGGITRGQDYLRNMHEMYKHFSETKHKVIFPYSEVNKKMLNREDCPEIKADIIFQMNCWHECGEFKQFAFRNNMDTLQAYIPYAWMISNRYWEHFNRDFHNVMWKIFYETPIHLEMAKRYSIVNGVNACATGYPQLDVFFDKSYQPIDVWKHQDGRKRIIWAPHSYIKDENKCSNFLYICEQMVEIAMKYKDEIQIAFKPHPELKKKLDYGIPGWNETRRKEYYRMWAEMPNTMLCEDEYIDLFLTSDAIIHDCGSFTAEYLCTYKPMLFLEANKDVIEGWNECGKAIAENIYRSDKGEKIEWFIDEIVLKGNDYMKEQRMAFVDAFLKPKDEKGASYAIYEILRKELRMK